MFWFAQIIWVGDLIIVFLFLFRIFGQNCDKIVTSQSFLSFSVGWSLPLAQGHVKKWRHFSRSLQVHGELPQLFLLIDQPVFRARGMIGGDSRWHHFAPPTIAPPGLWPPYLSNLRPSLYKLLLVPIVPPLSYLLFWKTVNSLWLYFFFLLLLYIISFSKMEFVSLVQDITMGNWFFTIREAYGVHQRVLRNTLHIEALSLPTFCLWSLFKDPLSVTVQEDD